MPVQHAPNIDEVRFFDVKNTMRVAGQGPKPKTRQVQFLGVSRRSRGGVTADVGTGFFQRINQTERGRRRTLVQITGNRLIDIPKGQFARDDRLTFHRVEVVRVAW